MQKEGKEMRLYVIYLQGAEAVKAGYAYQNGRCYRRILHDGEYAGQLEVVRDDEEAQLVAVSYIPESCVEFVKAELAENGFAGMDYWVFNYSDEECCEDEEFVQSGKIAENLPDLIITTTYGGLHVFRHDHCALDYHMGDDCVLEIMDANTGEVYKHTSGWDPMLLMREISELVKGR